MLKLTYSEQEIRTILNEKFTPEELSEIRIPFAVTPEMKKYAEKVTRGHYTAYSKSVALVKALIRNWDIEYESSAITTAQEAFRRRKANCLGFTNLFVGLSRAIGLKTRYVDVPMREEITLGNNIIIHSGHICAGLYDGEQFYLIDFSLSPRKSYRQYKEMDDLTALASFYNNLAASCIIGVEKERYQKAMKYFLIAEKIRPGFERVLNNKGVILHLLGDDSSAENAFRKALIAAPDMPEANYNLGCLLLSRMNYAGALPRLKRAAKEKPRNPYFHYYLGMVLEKSDKFSAAESEYRAALRLDASNELFFHALCRLFLKAHAYDKLGKFISKSRRKTPPEVWEKYSNIFHHLIAVEMMSDM